MTRRELFTREGFRVIRFGLVGITNTAIYTGLYAGFLALGLHYVHASIVAYVIAISIAYFLNHRFTFRVAEHSSGVVTRFFVVQASGALVNIALLAVLIDGAGWDELVAQFVILPPVVATTFLLNRFVVFHKHVDTRLS